MPNIPAIKEITDFNVSIIKLYGSGFINAVYIPNENSIMQYVRVINIIINVMIVQISEKSESPRLPLIFLSII